MHNRLEDHAQEWVQYKASIATDGKTIAEYRAERDAYVRGINSCDAVVGSVVLTDVSVPQGVIPVRIYTPSVKSSGPLPVILYLHGGGWTVGGGDALEGTYRSYCAATNCIVVVPDYRLAPENKFPAAVEDCWEVARWLASEAHTIGGDPSLIAVAGESAGGNLAAVLSAMARDDADVNFILQILVYPTLDLAGDTDSFVNAKDAITRDKLKWYMGCYINGPDDVANPLASPVRGDSFHGLPKTILITGSDEPALDEIKQYADKLRGEDVEVEYHCFEGWPHGFAFWPETDAYKAMMSAVTNAMKSAILQENKE